MLVLALFVMYLEACSTMCVAVVVGFGDVCVCVAAMSCTTCSAGYYCPQGAASETPCPNYHTSADGAWTCVACPSGKQCPDSDSANIANCASGTYSLGLQEACTTCPSGKPCTEGYHLICTIYPITEHLDYHILWTLYPSTEDMTPCDTRV